MSSQRRYRKLKRALLVPVNVVIDTLISLRDGAYQILSIVGLKGLRRRRRNRDFEKAGRESPRIETVDERASVNLEQADRMRDREILQQVRYEKRMLRKRTEEAERLREAMRNENLSVSQGDAISHLAKMNQREKERKAKEKAELEKAELEKAELEKAELEKAEIKTDRPAERERKRVEAKSNTVKRKSDSVKTSRVISKRTEAERKTDQKKIQIPDAKKAPPKKASLPKQKIESDEIIELVDDEEIIELTLDDHENA